MILKIIRINNMLKKGKIRIKGNTLLLVRGKALPREKISPANRKAAAKRRQNKQQINTVNRDFKRGWNHAKHFVWLMIIMYWISYLLRHYI